MLNYQYDNRFVILQDSTRQQSKRPVNGYAKANKFDYLNASIGGNNVGVSLEGLVLVDFDKIDATTKDIIIAEAKKYNTIIHVTDNNIINAQLSFAEQGDRKPDNTFGVHLYFSDEVKPNHKGNNIPLLFGINADIKSGKTEGAVIKLSKYEGCRIEISKHLNEANNLSFDALDPLPQVFQGIGKQVQEADSIKWNEGTRNAMWMKYVRALTNTFPEWEKEKLIEACEEVEKRFDVGNQDYKQIVPDWLKKAAKTGRFEDTNRLFWRNAKGGLIPHKLAESVAEKLNIKVFDKKLYFKAEKMSHFVTEADNGTLKRYMYGLDEKLADIDVSNAIKKLENYAPIGELVENSDNLVYTPTKVFDLKNNTVREIREEDFFLHSFKYEYNPNAYDAKMDQFLNDISLNRPEVRNDIIQALAVGITTANRRKLFMFYGAGSNGKGTLFNAYTSLFATKNSHKAIGLEAFADDKFMAAQLNNVLINVSDELDQEYLKQMGTIKSLISGNEIHGRDFGKAGNAFTPHVTMYLQGNVIPRTREKSKAINDRLAFIPMDLRGNTLNRNMSVNDFYKQFTTFEAQEYLFKLLMEKAKYLAEGNALEFSQQSQDLMKTFAENNDPIATWIETMGKNYFIDQSKNTKQFLLAAQLEGLTPTANSLNKAIANTFGLKVKKNGWKDPDTGRFSANTFTEITVGGTND